MRVTVKHTLEIEDLPDYIKEKISNLIYRANMTCRLLESVKDTTNSGKFIHASEVINEVRESLGSIDTNLSELQSICLSYDKFKLEEEAKKIHEKSHGTQSNA